MAPVFNSIKVKTDTIAETTPLDGTTADVQPRVSLLAPEWSATESAVVRRRGAGQ
jgi:hypothetical protein